MIILIYGSFTVNNRFLTIHMQISIFRDYEEQLSTLKESKKVVKILYILTTFFN